MEQSNTSARLTELNHPEYDRKWIELNDLRRTAVNQADVLKNRMEFLKKRQIRKEKAGRVAGWVLGRKQLPEMHLGSASSPRGDRYGLSPQRMRLQTPILMAEQTDEGGTAGWVLRLTASAPTVIVGSKIGPIEEYADFTREPLAVSWDTVDSAGQLLDSEERYRISWSGLSYQNGAGDWHQVDREYGHPILHEDIVAQTLLVNILKGAQTELG